MDNIKEKNPKGSLRLGKEFRSAEESKEVQTRESKVGSEFCALETKEVHNSKSSQLRSQRKTSVSKEVQTMSLDEIVSTSNASESKEVQTIKSNDFGCSPESTELEYLDSNESLPVSRVLEYDEVQILESLESGSHSDKLASEKLQSLDLSISRTVGTGTFGRVLVCRHSTNGQYYALKILSIAEVIRLKQVEHVKQEKSILLSISHPFIVNLFWASHDSTFLYMLLEYVAGGELFSYLRSAGRFNNATANFYAAEIVTALDYLHNLNIIYRDLKPENLLLDREGHVKITDFGFAKCVDDRTWTLCGTPEYLAPEIIQSKGHNKAVDWWALGILIYEMLAGYPPFFDDNPFAIYEKILQGKVDWPKQIDPIAKDIIKKLLVLDRTKRLGNMKNGTDDVRRHRWFKPICWDDAVERKLVPPIVPKVAHDGDTQCFDSYPDDDWHNRPAVGAVEQKLFHDF